MFSNGGVRTINFTKYTLYSNYTITLVGITSTACGVSNISADELEDIVLLAIDCLRAQIVPADEKRKIEEEVELAIAAAKATKASNYSHFIILVIFI